MLLVYECLSYDILTKVKGEIMKDNGVKNITNIHYYDHSKLRIDFFDDFHYECIIKRNMTREEFAQLLYHMSMDIIEKSKDKR